MGRFISDAEMASLEKAQPSQKKFISDEEMKALETTPAPSQSGNWFERVAKEYDPVGKIGGAVETVVSPIGKLANLIDEPAMPYIKGAAKKLPGAQSAWDYLNSPDAKSSYAQGLLAMEGAPSKEVEGLASTPKSELVAAGEVLPQTAKTVFESTVSPSNLLVPAAIKGLGKAAPMLERIATSPVPKKVAESTKVAGKRGLVSKAIDAVVPDGKIKDLADVANNEVMGRIAAYKSGLLAPIQGVSDLALLSTLGQKGLAWGLDNAPGLLSTKVTPYSLLGGTALKEGAKKR